MAVTTREYGGASVSVTVHRTTPQFGAAILGQQLGRVHVQYHLPFALLVLVRLPCKLLILVHQ